MRTVLRPYFPTLFAIFLLLLLGGCHSNEDTTTSDGRLAQAATMTVTTQKVAQKMFANKLIVTGTVEPWQTITLAAEINGLRILSAPFEVGDFVERGEPMLYLNSQELEAQLAAARARYDSGVASLAKARNPNRAQQVSSFKAGVEQAKAAVDQEKANLAQVKINQANSARSAQRFQEALKEGYVTALETDNRVTDKAVQEAAVRAAEQRVRAAQANLERAQQDLSLSQAQGRSEDIAMAQAQVAQDAATIEQLEAQLEKAVIKAPDSGLILSQTAFIGGVVTVGQELYTIARQGRLQVWATVPQEALSNVKVGQTVEFGAETDKIQGVIEEVDPSVNPDTRQGRIRVSLPNKRSDFKVGAFVEGQIALPQRDIPVILYEAVQGTTDESVVFVLEGNIARRVPVKLGTRHDELVEILSGLNPNDEVIVSGAAFLNDGDTVKVVEK